MEKRILFSLYFILLLCSCGKRQPRVVEEMVQFRDTIIDRGECCVCFYPPQYKILNAKMDSLDYKSIEYKCLDNQCDSILNIYIYYDTIKEEYDFRRDDEGRFFTRNLLSDNIQQDEKNGYNIEYNSWYDDTDEDHLYEYDYEKELYKSIVDFNNTPMVSDLTDYFKNIPSSVLYAKADEDFGVHAWPVDFIDRPYFENKLSQFQAYIDKKDKKFPMEIIDYIKSTEWQKSAYYNHAGDMIEAYYSYIFQYRLMQQIAYHCPYIELIANAGDISDDKMIAVAYWGFNNGCDGNTYVFLKQNSGFYTVDIIDGWYYDIYKSCHIETNTTVREDPVYSITHGTYSINYFYDGNKWHKIEIKK